MTDNLKEKNLVIELGLLAILAVLWGSSYLFVKIAVETIPPVTLIAGRVLVASIFLLGVLKWRGEVLPRDFKSWKMLLIQAFFNSIGAWTILAWGQQYVDSSLASVLNSTSPIFVFLITIAYTRHEATSVLKLVGAGIGVLGVTLIVGVDAVQGLGQQTFAQGAILFSAVLYACAAIYGKKFTYLPATVTATGTMMWAAFWLVPASLFLEQPWTLTPSNSSLVSAFILTVFNTGIALLIYFRLVQTLGSMGVASQSYLRAGVGVLLGIIVLNEHITILIGLGLVAAVLGVVLINFQPAKKQKALSKASDRAA